MQLRFQAVVAAVDGVASRPAAPDPILDDSILDDPILDGVSIDSRTVRPGQLFVPIVAERDGHLFIADARSAGAIAHLAQHGRATGEAGEIVVEDTTAALAALGRHARTRLADRVIGITGSSGKTTTKDLCAAILGRRGTVVAPEKSLNNEYGVPLTLINGDDSAWAAVIEMGARSDDQIARLCRVARPTVGVITNIGSAHLSEFGSQESIARAKRELFESLPATGTAIVWAASPFVSLLEEAAPGTVVRFDLAPGPGVHMWATDVTLDDDLRPRFVLHCPLGAALVNLPFSGSHQVLNALAAAAAAQAVGATLDEVVTGLAGARSSPWRMELHRLASGARIINDAYNANPASVRAALDALAATGAAPLIAILGPMLELGPSAARMHADVASYAAALGIDVWATQTDAYGVVPLAVEDIVERLATVGPNSAVLVKASRAAGLETIVAKALAASKRSER